MKIYLVGMPIVAAIAVSIYLIISVLSEWVTFEMVFQGVAWFWWIVVSLTATCFCIALSGKVGSEVLEWFKKRS